MARWPLRSDRKINLKRRTVVKAAPAPADVASSVTECLLPADATGAVAYLGAQQGHEQRRHRQMNLLASPRLSAS
jgi:hypothetical protein